MKNIKKFVIILVAGLSLASGVAFLKTPNQTEAARVPKVSSSYWYKIRPVYTKRRIKIQKVQVRRNGKLIVAYKRPIVKSHFLKKGTKVYVLVNSGQMWVLGKKVPGVGKAETKNYYWQVAYSEGNKWMSLTKPKKASHRK